MKEKTISGNIYGYMLEPNISKYICRNVATRREKKNAHTHTPIFLAFLKFHLVKSLNLAKKSCSQCLLRLCVCLYTHMPAGNSEPAPTTASRRMDGKWSGNNFLLGSSSLANHHGCYFLLLA